MRKKIQSSITFLSLFILAIAGCKKTPDFVDPAKILPPAVTKGYAYYVSGLTGNDVNDGFTITSAFKTISAAYNKVAAGDTVYLMNGTYTPTGSSILNITKSGTASKYITFKNYPGHTPKLYCSGAVWNAVVINGSYIIFDGIEVQGDNTNLDSASAFIAYSAALAGGTPNPQFNTNGVSIGGSGTDSKFPHHVVIRNCKIHDFPGGGLSSIQADYTTIEANTVYNNAWYMMYAGSGISILNPFNSDAPDITRYKNIVRNNISYNNKTLIPWVSLVPARLSDGNGIILDVNQYPYGGSAASNKPYNGRTLVENNVSFNNGGSGIHSYRADHVDIINNTAYGNGTKVGYADIYAGSATDVKIFNNIMYARTGGKCNSAPSGGTIVTYSNNIYFNGTYFLGTNDKVLNPQFINLSTDGTVANFSLSPASPAIDAGISTIYSAKDIKGIARPLGAAVDCGAYEVK